MTRADVEAAAEMINDGLGGDAWVELIRNCHVRYGGKPGTFLIATADGPVTVDISSGRHEVLP